ncbi:carbohydrate binding domain-containing protein [Paenibacillus nasutitermitis]|uniref:CBM-cenC domain-containing protein n=1 Tax=Paenibacillus nasutitermitis TaxID=1652958 RepID=A0A916ZAR2_9BACL|nr:carbohydrate binding domain-containing protein [Paenibacillus nasutitermitis]GGD83313.1 hypothetical protein GCM10010911_46850 [Paenibacillus nasutitermitis]
MRKKWAKRMTAAVAACVVAGTVGWTAPRAEAAGEEFQMGIFFMPTWPYTNSTQYDYIKDAGINLIQTFYPNDTGFSSIAQMNTVLDLAASRGIKVQVSDTRSANLMTTATNAEIDNIANTYKNHPATGGYYIKDEPGASAFPRAAQVYQRFLLNDPDSVPNVNMVPFLGISGLSSWVKAVDPANLKYLTLDRYPFPVSGGINGGFYQEMENLRSVGLSYNLKTAVYLQSVGIPGNLRRPNANELRWNVYNDLAYGVKGLYWFTWFQPVLTPGNEVFTTAIFDANGNKTDLYEPAKALGSEIKKLGPTLMGLTSRDVYVKGSRPVGTTTVPANYFWQPAAATDQLISHFANADGRSYVMVVNRDYANSQTLSFTLPSKPSAVTEVSKTTGSEVGTNYNNATGAISASFLPGEGKLYAISTDFALPAATVNDTDNGIVYSGGSWIYSEGRGVGDYGDNVHHATANNDYAQYTFTGTGIDFVTEKDPSGGNVDIYIDNVLQQTISTYGTVSNQSQQTVYSKTGLAAGTHTFKAVKKTGTYMVVDSFKVHSDNSVLRAAAKTNDTYSGIVYSGTGWGYSNGRGVGNFMNDLHYTTVNNDFFEYNFKGTGVDFLSETDPSGGDVDIYIDNVFKQTISTLGTASNKSQQSVYSISGLPYGSHTIKAVKKSGTYMVLDGFNEYSGSNLIVNPGFESGVISPWGNANGGTVTADAATKKSGSYGAKVSARTAPWSSPTQDVKAALLAAGEGNYNLSAWFKLGSGTGRGQVAIKLVDDSGTHYVSTDYKSINSSQWTQGTKLTNITWTGQLASAVMYVQTETGTTDLYVDDFMLSR